MVSEMEEYFGEPLPGPHEVVRDTTGSGLPRLTCRTCSDATVVRQPFMTESKWALTVAVFRSYHPFTEAASLERRPR